MSKTIIIFGAGINQLTLIRAAKELNVISVVLDPNEDAPGKEISDYFYCVKGNDYELTKTIALKHQVKALVTSQMEKPLRLMARLAQDIGLNFHSYEVVEKSLDKYLMKQAFLKYGVPCARGILFHKDENILQDKLKDLKYPLIIKPKDATSSQGVYKINQFEQIKLFVDISRSFSKTGEIIAEEFLDGPEFSVESITSKGKTTIVQFTEKFITPFPRTVEMAHLQPAPLNNEQSKAISKVVMKAIKAIGIDNSASHTEVKFTPNGPKIVEIGARLGGDFIASYLVLYSCGVNMDKAAIQVALGEEPDLQKKWQKYAYIKYLELEPNKRIVKMENWKEVINQNGVVYAHLNIKVGNVISEVTESSKRIGFVIVEGDSRKSVLENANKSLKYLISKIEMS